MEHIYQPDGVSCGPTCIKMAASFVNKTIDNIGVICKYCQTDNVIGTPPDRMILGLNKYSFNYKIHINDENPYNVLKTCLDGGSITILRTITKGIPHWIIVKDYNDENFNIYDPWLGIISYSEKELDNIWKVREYFFFEIKGINK